MLQSYITFVISPLSTVIIIGGIVGILIIPVQPPPPPDPFDAAVILPLLSIEIFAFVYAPGVTPVLAKVVEIDVEPDPVTSPERVIVWFPLIGVKPRAVVTSLPLKVTAPTLVLKLVTKLAVLRPKVTSPVPESTPVLLIVKGLLANNFVITACVAVVVSISTLRTAPSAIKNVPI
jgi:hypothetical protein